MFKSRYLKKESGNCKIAEELNLLSNGHVLVSLPPPRQSVVSSHRVHCRPGSSYSTTGVSGAFAS